MFIELKVWPEVLLGQQRGSKSDQNKSETPLHFLSIKYNSVADLKKIYPSFFLTFN